MAWILSNISELYDGASGEKKSVHTNLDIKVEGKKIEWVKPHDPSVKSGNGLTVVDAKGHTVTPGLIDCHGHITSLGINSDEVVKMNSTQQACSPSRGGRSSTPP